MSLAGVKLNLVESIDDAYEFKRWLGESRQALACDTETTGLHWWRDSLRLVQFGDTRTGWSVPWDRWSGVAVEALRVYDGPLVFHNSKFDAHFLERYGDLTLPWHRMHDTMTQAALLDSRQPKALKSLAVRYVDRKAAAGQSQLDEGMRKHGWSWATVPTDFEPYWVYAALDPVLTAHLHEQFHPRVVADYGDLYDLELAVVRVLKDMETRGLRVDGEYLEQAQRDLRHRVNELDANCRLKWNVNPGSNPQVCDRLKQDGIDLWATTPTGAFKLDEEVLLSVDHPLARLVLERRKGQKILGTYLKNFDDLRDERSYLHCSVHPLGARTGRMSVTAPALQTLPRDDTRVRNCIIPRDGNRLVLADFDQIEMRLLAHFAQEPVMIQAIIEGDRRTGEGEPGFDVHSMNTRRIYGIPDDQPVPKPLRQITKNAGFAIIYGAGVSKFALTAGVTEDAAREFLDTYHKTYPGVQRFQRLVERTSMTRLTQEGMAYVTSPWGRRHIADDGKEYALVNYLIQGTAADVFKQKLVELDLAGLGEYMLLPVHDEVVFDIPTEEVTDAVKKIEAVMVERDRFSVPLTAGVDVVDRWGEKYGG